MSFRNCLKRLLHTSKVVLVTAKKSPLATLREQTGYSLSNCKKALSLYPNDLLKAEEWLREEAKAGGWDKVNKLQSRLTTQGLIGIAYKNNVAAMIEVNCETDFVSRNAKFQQLVATGANLLLKQYPESNLTENEVSKITVSKPDLENLNTSNSLAPRLVDLVAANVNLIGENMVLSRGIVIRANKGCVLSGYAHPPLPQVDGISLGKYGAFVVYRAVKDLPEESELTLSDIGKQLCQHVIGRNPKAIGSKETDNPLENEEEETNLLFQEYLLNSEYTVGEYLEEYGLEVIDFLRFECGEPVI